MQAGSGLQFLLETVHTHIRKTHTHTCVDLEVLVQGVPLGEAAVTLLTLVGSGARVDVGVVPQVLFGRKALPTRLAHEGLLSCGEEDDGGGGNV